MSETTPCGCGQRPSPPPSSSCGCSAAPAPSSCCGAAALPVAPGSGFWARGGWLIPAAALGFLLHAGSGPFAQWMTARVLHLDLASRLGSAVAFFLDDAPKVLLLLAGVTFLVGFLQSFLKPERIREKLAQKSGIWGNMLASLFGIITPFCSCSAVPLFIGFVRVGVPLGVTFSYLVAAPMINEVALALLLALFGWKIAAIYAGTGLAVAFLSGVVLGRLRMERHVEPWVLEGQAEVQTRATTQGRKAFPDRVEEGRGLAAGVVRKVWPFILLGIGVGGFIHGYVPDGVLAALMGKGSWWTVPFAVLVGVPIYASTAVILPIVQSLLAKGAALGTVLAFMMAVTALSLPETIILRRVLKPRLIGVFLGVVSAGILAVGYLFNIIL